MLLEAISNPDNCVVSPPPFSLVVALCAPFRVRFHNSCVLCRDGIVSTAEQASQLVFSAALFKETLRMLPPVPMTFLYSTVRRAPCVCDSFFAGAVHYPPPLDCMRCCLDKPSHPPVCVWKS